VPIVEIFSTIDRSSVSRPWLGKATEVRRPFCSASPDLDEMHYAAACACIRTIDLGGERPINGDPLRVNAPVPCGQHAKAMFLPVWFAAIAMLVFVFQLWCNNADREMYYICLFRCVMKNRR
jgi:hypothetical protein